MSKIKEMSLGEVVDFDKNLSQSIEDPSFKRELAENIASLAILAPAVAAEVSNRAAETGSRIVKRLLAPKPKTPDIPWHTPYDTREELRDLGFSDQEIGQHERFKKKSHSNLRNLAKIGD
jgi:hypothetical protein